MQNSTAFQKSLALTSAVWKALFLREAGVRMFGSRMAWIWLIVEPLINVMWLVAIFTIIRVRHIGGIETPLWIAIGMLVFMTFRRTLTQVQNGIDANKSLFAYRQVRPGDVALVRALVEGFLMFLISTAVFFAGAFIGWMAWPANAWGVLEAFMAAWLCAVGLGLVFAVLVKLVPEAGRIIGFIMTPLMMISGVIFPLSAIQEPYLSLLLFNPLAHAVEAARIAFSPYYHSVPGVDLLFVYQSALVLVFVGLALLRRFNQRLVMD